MDCRKARTLIPYAADGALDEPSFARLQAHLTSCEACTGLLDSQRSAIRDLDDAIKSAAQHVVLPDDFAASVAALAAAELSPTCKLISLRDRAARVFAAFVSSRKAVAAAVCTAMIVITVLIGTAAGRVLDSSPVASTRVTSGHLVVFTVNPRPDGRVVASVNAHRYCQITRSREEALR